MAFGGCCKSFGDGHEHSKKLATHPITISYPGGLLSLTNTGVGDRTDACHPSFARLGKGVGEHVTVTGGTDQLGKAIAPVCST